jgi:hypothetical protein
MTRCSASSASALVRRLGAVGALGSSPSPGGGSSMMRGVFPQVDQLLRHLDHGQHEVDHAGADGRQRHAVVLGVGGQLHDRDAALFLDAREPTAPSRAGAGQDDRHRALAVHLGQGAEEQVDGDVLAARTLELVTSSTPSTIDRCLLGAITYTWSGSI